MKANMGTIDRVVRVLAAVVLAVLYFTGKVTGFWGIILLVVAAAFIVTSMASYCPFYEPLKINTKK